MSARCQITFEVAESEWHQVVVRDEGSPAAVLPDLVRFFLAVAERDDLARRFINWSAETGRPAPQMRTRVGLSRAGFVYQVDLDDGGVHVTLYRVQARSLRLCGFVSVSVFCGVLRGAV